MPRLDGKCQTLIKWGSVENPHRRECRLEGFCAFCDMTSALSATEMDRVLERSSLAGDKKKGKTNWHLGVITTSYFLK